MFLDARAFPQANNRQVTPAIRASQTTNNSQAGRLTPRASPQASQEDSTLPQSTIYQADSPQGKECNLSGRQSPVFSGRQFPALPGDSTLPQSDLSQAGSSQASPVVSTLSPAESKISQGSSSQSSQKTALFPRVMSPRQAIPRLPQERALSHW